MNRNHALVARDQDDAPLARLEEAKRILAQARSVDVIKTIRDQAEAARLYARQRDMGLAMQNDCAEIKLRAERRLGEVLATSPKHLGGKPSANPSPQSRGLVPKLADLGLSYDESSRFQEIAALPEPVFERHVAEAKAAGDELTTASVVRLARETRAQKEHEQVEEAIALADDGTVARAKLRVSVMKGQKAAGDLFTLTPAAVAGVLSEGDFAALEYCVARGVEWFAAVKAARVTGPRLLRRNE